MLTGQSRASRTTAAAGSVSLFHPAISVSRRPQRGRWHYLVLTARDQGVAWVTFGFRVQSPGGR